MKLWASMSAPAKTRLATTLSILFLAAAAASFLHYRAQIINTQSIHQKISARAAQARREAVKAPAMSVAATPEALRRQLEDVSASVAALRERIAAAETRLVAPDDTAARQALQVSISRIADAAGLRVAKFALRGRPPEREGTPPTTDRMSAVFDNPFRRPLYDFSARTTFAQALAFLDELAALPNAVAPVQFAARVRSETLPAAGKASPAQVQWMELDLVLAL